jgi:hypothetical protein
MDVFGDSVMHVQTKFLRLCEPAELGDRFAEWRVIWIGGWDSLHVRDTRSRAPTLKDFDDT